SLFLVLCFFFQAEDGIRDRNVTGVQTCALPIYSFCRKYLCVFIYPYESLFRFSQSENEHLWDNRDKWKNKYCPHFDANFIKNRAKNSCPRHYWDSHR